MVSSLNAIAAVSQNMGIGKNGTLPWPPLRNEFKYFQRMTTTPSVPGKQNVLIMGKKTWFSIPEKNRPLKDRINIVLSRELAEVPKGAHHLARSLDDALVLLDSPELKNKIDLVWIVGGSSVYKAAWSHHTFDEMEVFRRHHVLEIKLLEGAGESRYCIAFLQWTPAFIWSILNSTLFYHS
ncbi:PREDICTED: dihydrofolate reductase isoform X2 [Crocodylus porosus]|uniref:dihydrofolate reductase isoform X2 n=1 Tax=Crocodylus porosus TaxID=8502 RepID=UPI00093935A8|nr:PREDICTED: dihydrofolate reductase isoform X2 [Crocodylus porosus]